MITYYGSQISPNKVETSEGFLICRNVPIARIGKQDYLARELQLDGDPNKMVSVNRYEQDVFDKATLASFEGKPVTDGHPSESVAPENFGRLAKGHVQNVRREGDYIVADLYVNDANLISDIQNGVKKEVSCGYLCNYEEDGDGYKQTHIRGNHVAVVQSGRAGHEVAIKDAAAETAEERTKVMSKFSKAVLTAFGVAAKDAKEEELEELTALAQTALDSEPAVPAEEAPEAEEKEVPAEEKEAAADEEVIEEKAEEEEVKDEMVEKAPKGDDLGTKLDKVIEMLSEVLKKKTEDEDPEEAKDEDISSEVIEEEEAEDCDKSDKTADALIKALRPAIAGISNKDERARVSKAILEAVGTKSADYNAIFEASQKGAKASMDSSAKSSYEKRCEESQSAYAALNPHHKKER